MSWILSCFADEAGQDMDTQIATLNKAGVDHIDLRNVDGTVITELPVDQARQVRQKLDAAGIRVNMFGLPIGKIDLADPMEIDEKRLRHLAELKGIFDCRAVRMFSYRNKQAGGDHDAFREKAIERMRRLVALAEQLDLVLYHENECGIFGMKVADVEAIRDELRGSGNPHFKMIYDWANYQHAGEDPWAAWLALRDSTDAFHLKEARFNPDGSDEHCPVGEGDGQVPAVLEDAAKRGWEGPLTVEPHLKGSAMVYAPDNLPFKEMPADKSCLIALEAAKKQLLAVGKR